MHRLLYFSKNRMTASRHTMIEQITEILDAAKRHNRPNGVTGALVFDGHWFIQMLEGERPVVWSTFLRLQNDPRHSDVELVELAPAAGRQFGAWWMGYAERNADIESAFAPYVRAGKLEPQNMCAAQMAALLCAVAKERASREVSTKVMA